MKSENFVLCQNEVCSGAEYHTFGLMRKSAFGFVCFVPAFEFVSHVAFDSVSEYTKMLDCPNGGEVGDDDYSKLEELEIGEQTNIGDAIWLRLW